MCPCIVCSPCFVPRCMLAAFAVLHAKRSVLPPHITSHLSFYPSQFTIDETIKMTLKIDSKFECRCYRLSILPTIDTTKKKMASKSLSEYPYTLVPVPCRVAVDTASARCTVRTCRTRATAPPRARTRSAPVSAADGPTPTPSRSPAAVCKYLRRFKKEYLGLYL